ncbi:D-inositol-3-phosphate glycosyltransferase [Actinopolymorpha cephalotaxi]|uniref:D-inositol-3-phosphate glycosyltransferase n=2 Tax=Actinopolymorpha cephalotaxi TaxID=504797 RepID=A0A1I2Y2M2_9ACTN|nr:D-inositol-3-phosphate glycosyltransferase [Actinopolymorpha cephalotaxi]SFH19892.1 D-inositol-3-phosphate glycosyltransferase [Actinopolymorpha cephalotaxi]
MRHGSVPRRVAMLSVHTSPLDQPGTGDAGGMNVYVVELARRMAALDIEVEIFTRATSSDQPPIVEAEPGVRVRHVVAGPFAGLAKDELPAQLCAFARGVLRTEAAHDLGWYDLIHSHYWLSGQVGALAKERWGVPLVHSMHTMAKVKNAQLAKGDRPEPRARVIGEEQVVEAADWLVANTDEEARQLIELYDADPAGVVTVNPGVDLDVFAPGDTRAARRELGLPEDAAVLMFAGRIQPLKAPDVLVRATAELLRARPELRRRLVVAVVGGPSGSGTSAPGKLARLARDLGLADVVRFVPPVRQAELARWYHAATLVAVPSYNESFGLVALEAQACGTPVVAAATGGLLTAVADDVSGALVDGHDPRRWARVLEGLLDDSDRLARLGAGGVRHAQGFGWAVTAARMLDVYSAALARPERRVSMLR